jgi:hypothetical protein
MATLSSQLSSQLLKYLHKHPDVTQKDVAEYLNLSQSFLSEIIGGKKNLNGLAAMKLSQFLEKPAAAADPTVRQFSFKGKKLTSHLEHIRFGEDSGWYPGADGSGAGQDPNDTVGRSIDDAPDAVTAGPGLWDQSLIDSLREARGYHRFICRAISSFIQNAKANRDGSTAATAQRFSTRNIIKTMCFSTDDAPTATKDLLAVLSTLDPQTRTKVISSILAAFPQFTRT